MLVEPYMDEWPADVKLHSTSELPTYSHGAFSIRPQSEKASPAGEEDGCAFKVVVTNNLPCVGLIPHL